MKNLLKGIVNVVKDHPGETIFIGGFIAYCAAIYHDIKHYEDNVEKEMLREK